MGVCLEIVGLIVSVFLFLRSSIEVPMPGVLAVFYLAVVDDL